MQLPTPAPIKCQILEPHEFDEPGEELGRDAQVHKAYVRETNRVDLELVDGWNGTVDVVLIFSTLFSAIITPLVIETTKRLRQGPINISAKVPSITYQDQRFTTGAPDSRLIVVINALWCLFLSLSVAVSFIAMLSKEWFFQFMSGRVGSSATQARRRQQRWTKVLQWKLEIVISALPAAIHIALLCFSVGLCLYLWDLGSPAVAIPATVVVALMVSLCVAFTMVGPLMDDYCPYITSTARIYYVVRGENPQAVPDELPQDGITMSIIYYIITRSNSSRSVELALQSLSAIKGIGTELYLLEECKVWTLVWSGFQALQPYNLQFDSNASLYARVFLNLERLNYNGADRLVIRPEKTCLFLWAIQGYVRQRSQYHARDAGMRHEVTQLGRAVVHHCLKALKHSSTIQHGLEDNYYESAESLGLIEHVAALLHRPDIPVYEVYGDICTSFTLLICSALLHCSPSTVSPFIKRFLRAHHSNYTPEYALALGTFEFSRNKYPTIVPPMAFAQAQDHAVRVERALSVVWYYVSIEENYPEELAVLGLPYLQAHPASYHLEMEDREGASRALAHYTETAGGIGASIYTLPAYCDVHAAHH